MWHPLLQQQPLGGQNMNFISLAALFTLHSLKDEAWKS